MLHVTERIQHAGFSETMALHASNRFGVQVLSFRVFPAYCTWHSGPNSSVQVLHVSRLPIRGLRGAEMMSQVTAILSTVSGATGSIFDTAVF